MNDMRLCFCVLGWHYLDEFYDQLYEMPGDKHIISHRDASFLAGRALQDKIGGELRVMPNVGLDWGGYQQFNELIDLSRYDVVIYCHDDVIIKDTTFSQAVCEKLGDGAVKVVGNGNNGADSEFRYGKYRHVMRWEDDDDFVVRTVRGSFFAVRTEIFDRIDKFPVHWEASERNLKKGNISLRNFGYIVSKTYGVDAITYLEPESWLETRYLVEMRRGIAVAGNARATDG